MARANDKKATDTAQRLSRAALTDFCRDVFIAHGLNHDDATLSAAVLVAADARGIPSHGVARLPRYVGGLETGTIVAGTAPQILHETPLSLALDARGAMGAPVSQQAMDAAIAKARTSGAGFATVRDSNHFGIAAWYAMAALEHDMIGIAMTNTAALGVPTHGTQAMFGTNPIAFAAPAERERAFVLDMSTTAVTYGKIEVYARQGQPLPAGWASDARGRQAVDAASLWESMNRYAGGGLHPLGGAGTALGGHKGYGLATMVDILSGVLSGHGFGQHLHDTPSAMGRVGHFFAAFRIDMFREASEFRRDMDQLLGELRASPPGEGQSRVYYAGLKEIEREDEAAESGVRVADNVVEALIAEGARVGVTLPPGVDRQRREPRS
ncbi:Malate/lactate/ureidoglycolate dehydrogenase, LDH2 family [Modicisalibacter muralis]|uniref:Malate/lactate/ureidoglycolate dehydrogenase, LDH2 family n=1 Tax=Modicisalibacter muralis TaxID=119000 RepID=A0A1G9Q5J0_9GAMM|nr:Ldh family oxidoreductase [Halomonas muralis]SDM06312.1 Malate/lactate/ureidoglycolate dehydrogenase, LDH2 family [Halomonas muralis]